ncbi:histidine kinase [Bacillus sp. M6-12]|uniref:GAF domain-containing sensor histidine kinase n=1 Tax=Bacillus sp. M6-12 TaxID=2054166 RepID=UPI000C75BF8E|nr:GAF domain-containing sensor histidine kinase [Bacillus sp. M6-12]PLS17034.1 histidine kinase [Bacillus sp. M6-12]
MAFLSELKVLKEIAETLNEGSELSAVLNEVLARLLTVTKFDAGWIFLIDEQGGYELAASKQLPPALLNEEIQPMCNGECWCIDRFRKGALKKATNIIECQRLEDAIELNWGDTRGLTHHATVPLQAADEKFGLLNIAAAHKTIFSQEELTLLESVAYQIGTAIKRIKLSRTEQEMRVAEERNRLAKDLHDSVNQLLFTINITARAGQSVISEAKGKEAFSAIQQMAQHAQAEMKALIWQLRPQGLEKGLATALVNYAEMIGLKVLSDVKGVYTLPSAVEEALWRIGQEAFNNCRKYSGQENVEMQIILEKMEVSMTIRDNGIGFLCDRGEHIPANGLRNMKERAAALKGSVEIKSNPGAGTAVIVKIPF